MKKVILSVVVAASLALTGCAKTQPNPNIIAVQPSDNNASCLILANDLQTAKNQLAEAKHERSVQTGANVANGIFGIFTLVNWFFIDTGNGHDIDAQNAQARVTHLQALMADKNCRR